MPTSNNAMYNDFIDHCNKQKEYYLKEIHDAYKLVHEYYNDIMNHVSLLNTKGIKVVNPAAKYSRIEIDNVWDLPKELHNAIKAYNYIGYDRIDTLIEHYKYYSRIAYIPAFHYNAIQKVINRTIINSIVEGNIYSLGSHMDGYLQTEEIDGKIGSMYIKEIRLSRDIMSKAASYNSHNLNKEVNKDAKLIHIYVGEGSVFYKWKWRMVGIPDYCKKYGYRMNRTSQSVNRMLHLSNEEVMAHIGISGFIKMCILLRNNPDHKYKYQRKNNL